jgi:hypothetical protein
VWKTGTDHLSESGIKRWMSSGATRQRDRTLGSPRAGAHARDGELRHRMTDGGRK